MTRSPRSFLQAVDEEIDIVAGIEPALPTPESYWTIERARTAQPAVSVKPANLNENGRRAALSAPHGRVMAVLAGVFAALLTASILWAGFGRGASLWEDAAAIAARPWGIVTFIDLYVGFALFAGLIIAMERRLVTGLLWAAPILLLGNVWTAVWLIVRGRRRLARAW